MARRTLAPTLALALALAVGVAGVPRAAWAQDGAEPAATSAEAPATGAAAEAPAADAPAYSADEPPALSSPVALLVDRDTGYVLFEQGADEQRTPASITKILTALLVLENMDLDDVVTVEEGDFEHVTAESTTAGLKAGDVLTVRDLLAGLLLPSGNDAAYVLARAVGGDWQTFVGMMNERAAELGCTSTHFSDPCGLAEENHYTTARDLVTVFEAALAYPAFQEIAGSSTWQMPATGDNPARTITTTDLLLDPESPVYMGDEIVAGKTGFTYDAGKCLIVAAQRDGMNLVGVVLGGSDEEDADGVTPNYYDMRSLLAWGFGAWETGEVVSAGDVVASAEVTLSSDGDAVDARSDDAIVTTFPRGTTIADLTVEPSWEGAFQAPIEEGDALGEAAISLDGRALGTVGVSAASTMELSLVDYALWWVTSDPVHMGIVAGVVVAVFVVTGLVSAAAGRRRRRRDQFTIAVGERRTIAPGPGGQRLKPPSAKSGKHFK